LKDGPDLVETSEVRRRFLAAMERARRDAAERRARTDQARRDYEEFLAQRAIPLFHQVAAALKAEGHAFAVLTPAGSVRLASDRSSEEFIEVILDDSLQPPAVVGRSARGRGRRTVSNERPISESKSIADLTEQDVLTYLLEEIVLLIER
jgi:hypothetical protein